MRNILVLLLAATIALTGCNPDKPTENANQNSNSNSNVSRIVNTPPPIKPEGPVDPNFKPCNPYYPLVPGSQLEYTLVISSGLVNDVTIVVDEAEENGRKVFVERSRAVDKTGGLEKAELSVRKYVCDSGRIQIVAEKTNNNIQGQATEFEHVFNNTAVLMTDPQSLGRKGTTWSYSFRQIIRLPGNPEVRPEEPITIVFTVEGEEEVTVPAGKFKALKIKRQVGDFEVAEYFVRGIGMVRRVAVEGTSWALTGYSGVSAAE